MNGVFNKTDTIPTRSVSGNRRLSSRKSIISKLIIKIRLLKIGVRLIDKYYLQKYSIDYYMKKINYNIKWSNKDIILNLFYNGKYLQINTKDNVYFLTIFREIFGEESYKFCLKLGDDIKTIIDLGANTGLFTLFCFTQYPYTKYYCFEPDKNNFKHLIKNIVLNNINAGVFEKAIVGNGSIDKVKLYDSYSSTAFSLIKNSNTSSYYTEVEAITLDKIVEKNSINCIDILKCDIEGSEGEVFRNISDEVLNKTKFIIVEYHSEENKMEITNRLKERFKLIEVKIQNNNELGIMFDEKR